jgi:hypothetical protein
MKVSRELSGSIVTKLLSTFLYHPNLKKCFGVPQPIMNKARVVIISNTDATGKLTVSNQNGQTIRTTEVNITRANTSVPLNFNHFPKGDYIVLVNWAGESKKTQVIKE